MIDGAGHLRAGHRRRRAAAPRRDGVPEVEPVPEVDLRERRLRPPHQRPGARSRRDLDERVEESLRPAALWDEVKDRLHESALALSGGQQQRLCIARALAVRPEVLLMDEPASALDPIATQRIEELIYELKRDYTIVIVTHNMQQAARVSDYTAFFWLGKLVEFGPTEQHLHRPGREADGGLRHRDGSAKSAMTAMRRLNIASGISRRSSSSSRRGCSKWAGWPRSACAPAVRGARRARPARWSSRCSTATTPINQLHIEIDDRCFKLLALHQPMAVDLRAIVSAVKINTDLERVGDLAVNIAEAVAPLPAAPAGQGADRHPADGRHRAGHAARRARRLRAPRHRRWPSSVLDAGRRAGHAEDAGVPRAARPTCCRTRPRSSRRWI